MRAFIKMDKWASFMINHTLYGFLTDVRANEKSVYVRNIGHDANEPLPIYLVITMDRELHLVTPMGESPFMESHEADFSDLIDDDLIEYVKGEFD